LVSSSEDFPKQRVTTRKRTCRICYLY